MKLGKPIADSEKGKKKWLVPTDSYQKSQIKRVTKRAAIELLQYNIDVDLKSFELYTTAVFYIKAALEYLNVKYEKDRDVDISLGGLIEVGLSIREVPDAEKIGSINGVVNLGPGGEFIKDNIKSFVEVKTGGETKEFLIPETEEEAIDIQKIQSMVSRSLTSYDLFFKPDDMGLYTMIMVFLKSAIVITAMETIVNGSSIINIGEMIAVNGVLDDGELIIKCDLGSAGKQIVKSDGATEDE